MLALRSPLLTLIFTLGMQCAQAIAQSNDTISFESNYWNNINPDPDVWGSVPIRAPRLDRPYPGRWDSTPSPSEGWHVDLRIKAQVIDENDDHNRNITLMTMHFRPPPPGQPGALLDAETGNWSVGSNISSTWRVSLVSLIRRNSPERAENFNEVEEPNDDVDGSCPTSVLSDTCVRELRARIAALPNVRNGIMVENFIDIEKDDEDYALPPSGSCAEYFEKYWVTRVELNDKFNKTNFDLYPPWATSIEGEDLGVYDALGRKTYPTIVVWGHGNSTERGEPIPEDHVTIACVKADNVKEGVKEPKGAAGGLDPSKVWVVGSWAAIVLIVTELLT